MKNRLKKTLKAFILFTIVSVLLLIGIFIAFDRGLFKGFASKKLNANLLEVLNTPIEIYDKDGNPIENDIYIRKLTNIDDLPKYVGDAFISIEDKTFYKHNGLNYKSMIRALLCNIKNGAFVQGGSTISQQLIKNTHLSNKKTLSRKIDEMFLTQQLEDSFSKKEILQAYLNVIYFGQGTFGIEQASQKYFSKSAKDLTISEAATLAGIIKSPLKYSPILNYNNCESRRNLVLQEMYMAQKITKEEFDSAINQKLKVNISNTDLGENNYNSMAIAEASKLLNLPEQDIILGGYKIYTNQDITMQHKAEEVLASQLDNYDKLICVIDNKTNGIAAYIGNSNYNLSNKKMQPGSIIKPLAVYSPAIDKNIVTTSTMILDDKLNINGYSPKNYDGKYNGWVSVKESLSKSLNIPAVKLLEYVGITTAKNYCKKFGVDIDDNSGYSIALGGLSSGVKFLDIVNSYTTFANKGKLKNYSFVREIKNKYGRTIVQNTPRQRQVISSDSAYLITDMLKESVATGTAKKLKDISYNNIASKTGTAGDIDGNTDIWNIAYTPKYTVASWLGSDGKDKLPLTYTGGNQTTLLSKKLLREINDKSQFLRPKTITEKAISTIDLAENNKVVLASDTTPSRYKKIEIFSAKNIPKEVSKKLEVVPSISLESKVADGKIELSFLAKNYVTYYVIKKDKNGEHLVEKIENKSGKCLILDKLPNDNSIIRYFVKYQISGINSQKYEISEPIKILSNDWSDLE